MEPQDTVKAQLMTEEDLARTLDRMARQIVDFLDLTEENADSAALVGMQTRGVYLARRLRDRIARVEGFQLHFGVLDATMYRDDFRLRMKHPVVRSTDIPFDVSGRDLILVDDVLYTGRTVRSALDALMDMGRPSSVTLLVIVDRGLHELPVTADIVGRRVPTIAGEEVRVRLREVDDREGVWLVSNPRAVQA